MPSPRPAPLQSYMLRINVNVQVLVQKVIGTLPSNNLPALHMPLKYPMMVRREGSLVPSMKQRESHVLLGALSFGAAG